MKELDHSIIATVSERAGVALYRAIGRDGAPVLLKVIDPSRCSQRIVDQLRGELESASFLAGAAVVRPLELGTHRALPALLLENFDGEPCGSAQAGPMPLEPFLALAARIADALSSVHRADIVHKALAPHDILVHPVTGEVRLTGFGLSARLSRDADALAPPPLIEGSLPYLSPEQTGRMQANVDVRADLYSLGIVLFELLTGQLPFQAHDPLEWVHCHVARPPPSPSEILPGVPEVVGSIVRRLLAKRPEDRYQSARGLGRDLERCHRAWRTDGSIVPFRLGELDLSDRLEIPQRLVGRDAETAILSAALARVCDSGAPEVVLVSGPSGVGKSSLANQLERGAVRFLRGKFDEVSRAIPYCTVAYAFSELVLGILAEDEAGLARWRALLVEALGGLGKLITSVIPSLRLVIGEPPEVPELPLAEAEQRFRRVFRAFVRVFTSKTRPLVLFLDDLQWADAGSLRWVADLATSGDTHHLLFVLAYRDAEIDPEGPLPSLLARLHSATATTFVALEPLGAAQVAELVAGVVRAEGDSAHPLATLVYEKAGGSPFFVIQFLTTLYRERLLRLDEATATWRWDLERIREQRYTENVVELMVRRLDRLSARARGALAIAACIGNRFSLPLLAATAGRPEEMMRADLATPLRDGLLVLAREGFAFAHDRFRHAAASLSSDEERSDIHLRIGQLLLSLTPPERLEESIFEIVAHLDLGAARIARREQQVEAAALAWRAAQKARSTAAYAAAAGYAAAGLRLIGDEGWLDARDLTFALGLGHAQCALCAGQLVETDRLLPTLLIQSRTRLERALVYGVEIDSHNIKGEGSRAIDCALACLREFGIDMSAHPSDEDVARVTAAMWEMLGDRTIEQLIDLPRMVDPEVDAALEILARLYIAAYYSDNNLLCVHLCEAVCLSLRHGNAPSSSHAYGWFGVILISMLHRPNEGYRFAKLGFDLVQRQGSTAFLGKAHLQMKIACLWTRSLGEALAHCQAAFDSARESGDVAIECFACSEAILTMIARGDRLADVERQIAQGLAVVRRAGFGDVLELILMLERFVRTLAGKSRSIASFDDDGFSEADYESRLAWDRMPSLVFYYLSVKLMARVLAGENEAAVATGKRARPYLWAGLFASQSHWFHVFDALALAAVCEGVPDPEREEALSSLAGHERQLREWAEANPATFQSDHQLVCAEIARVRGQADPRLYDEAIRSARENGFVHRAALAHEIAARHYRRSGFEFIADAYLREARALYARWGAEGKVRQLDRLRPGLVEERTGEAWSTMAVSPYELDLLAIVRGTQAISSELRSDRIAAALLEVVLEHGGAKRGALFVIRGGELVLEAEALTSARGVHIRMLAEAPGTIPPELPATLIQFARRTRQAVILADAAADPGPFAADGYLVRQRPRSVLAFPIQRQSELVALLYLENELVPGAFTSERLSALGVVAAQAAISLENASLLAKERSAVSAAEEAHRHSALMAEATSLLIEPLPHEEALARLARLCVRDFAQRCAIDWLDGDDTRRLCEADAEPARDPGNESFVSAPLVARGQTLGTLTLGFWTRRPTSADRELTLQLADRAAMALDNARLRREERNLRERLERADRLASLGTLAAGVAHEISNPAAYVAANLSFLQEELGRRRATGDANVELRHAVEEGLAGMARIRHIVSGLKQFARPSGHDRALVDVRAELTAALDMTRQEIAKRARLVVELPADLPCVVAGATELGQVFVNLLVNAAQAIPEGHRTENEVRLVARATGGQVVVEVRDTGAGIAPEIVKRIFDPFFTTKPAGTGTGLGLSICHGIVTAIGGAIEVSRAPGAGTLFRVRFPAAGVSTAPPPRQAAVSDPERRARVLVVDDEVLVARGLARLLSGNHDVDMAVSSKDALARLLGGERYDVVLCDLMMPEMDGMELEARIAEAAPEMVGRLVFVTGGAVSPAARTFLEAGRLYLDKPVDPSLLRSVIAERSRMIGS